MSVKAIQSGFSQINFSDQDVSQALLVVGIGVLTYEIVSKVVHKYASETASKIWATPLLASTLAMYYVSKIELSELNTRFIGFCILYAAVSIGSRANPASIPDYMVDMVAEAKGGAYLPKIGYEEAVKKVEVLMNKNKKPNALLLANPGVGKSTIPETIAYKIANKQYLPRSVFFEAKLISVDFTDLMAGTMYRGLLEQRIREMTQLAKKDPKIIYFIDEIHKLTGGGQTMESRVDVSEMLLPVLARGDIRVIGASTFDDYNRCIKPKQAFARRLPQVQVNEPTLGKCYEMLQYSYGQILKQGHIKISDKAIAAAIFFSKDIPQRYFPDKAVDLIDDAISHAELYDDTENDLILTEKHIAKAVNSSEADALILSFKGFFDQNGHFFSGVNVNEEVD
jgi:ATP-dependent Clp protease ATP-binding subunit ClpA